MSSAEKATLAGRCGAEEKSEAAGLAGGIGCFGLRAEQASSISFRRPRLRDRPRPCSPAAREQRTQRRARQGKWKPAESRQLTAACTQPARSQPLLLTPRQQRRDRPRSLRSLSQPRLQLLTHRQRLPKQAPLKQPARKKTSALVTAQREWEEAAQRRGVGIALRGLQAAQRSAPSFGHSKKRAPAKARWLQAPRRQELWARSLVATESTGLVFILPPRARLRGPSFYPHWQLLSPSYRGGADSVDAHRLHGFGRMVDGCVQDHLPALSSFILSQLEFKGPGPTFLFRLDKLFL